jgi:hypothetical protein
MRFCSPTFVRHGIGARPGEQDLIVRTLDAVDHPRRVKDQSFTSGFRQAWMVDDCESLEFPSRSSPHASLEPSSISAVTVTYE